MFHFCNFNFKFYNFKNIQKKKKRKEREGGGEVIPCQEIRDYCSEAAEGESGTWASSSSASDSLHNLG